MIISSRVPHVSADECLEALKAQLLLCTATKTKSVTNAKKPWINTELLDLISTRDRYFQLHKKFPNNIFVDNKYPDEKKMAIYG